MKRRDFTKGLVALSVAPAVPLQSLAATGTAATGAVTANFTPYSYALGVQHARGLGQCSSAILAERLGLQPQVASAINARMIKQGIISAPNALGVSELAKPKIVPAIKPDQGVVRPAKVANETTSEPFEKIKDTVERLADPDMSEDKEVVDPATAPEVDAHDTLMS